MHDSPHAVSRRTFADTSEDFQRIDQKWQLVQLLGEGQWTTVYQARPSGCPADWPSDYAIKVLKTEFEQDTRARDQLRREARVGQAVTHAHLISILSSSLERAPYYVVMPYLVGETLATRLLNRYPLRLPQALWIARQIADSLQAMHMHDWIHADVKPSNILISEHGHVTLLDLGFAQHLDDVSRTSDELVGTINYAAPEVFVPGRPCDGQTDVYSLGVTLFEMVTGRLPFAHEDPCDLAVAHLRQPPPEPRNFVPTLPPRVVRLLKRMLAKEPMRRPSAKELTCTLLDLEIETFDDWDVAC